MPGTDRRHYRFETFRLDTQTRELRDGDGSPLALTAKAFDTLRLLIEHRHRIVGKDELLETVWAGRVVEENNLTQAVSAVRRALGSGAGDHRYVVTVPGRGYQFVAEVREDDPRPVQPPLPETGGVAPGNVVQSPAIGPRMIAFGTLLLVLGLSAAVAWRMHVAKPVAAPALVQSSLAVLPFRSLDAGPRDDLLELGLADTLITRISESTTLRVHSLSSSQRFAGASQDPIDAGRQLGARYVVDGTIQRSGDRVRVSTHLTDVRDARPVWSGSFDESIDRVFTLQDNIAAAVTNALELTASVQPAGRRSPCDGANAEAYRAYLTGKYQLDRPSAPRMRAAITAFQHAIDMDPSCARAYAGLAFAYRAQVMTGDAAPREKFPLAKAAVERALAIDPRLAEAYSSQGFIQFWFDWDWAAAEASFRRAIALNPNLAEAHMAYAHLLANLGRGAEAATQARQAIALDPLSPLVNTLGSAFLAVSGYPDEGRQHLQKAMDLDPGFFTEYLVRGSMRMEQGDTTGALADLRRARQLCGDCAQVLAVLGPALAQTGDRAGAQAILRGLEARASTGYMPAASIAAVRNGLGDTEGALALLERAYVDRDVRMTFLLRDSNWDNLRTQPRFQALMRRMEFPVAAVPPPDDRGQNNQVSESAKVRGGP